MYYAPMPLPVLALLVVALVCYLHKHRDKKLLYHDLPKIDSSPHLDRIEEIVKKHRDCTAIICDANAYSFEKAQITTKHIPGDPVVLKIVDGRLSLFVDGFFITSLYFVNDPNINGIVERGDAYDAYIFERDIAASSPKWMDFISIIIFYKMDGVPPTDVKIDL